jgi:peptidoglycan DL-endopeptidase CwlO
VLAGAGAAALAAVTLLPTTSHAEPTIQEVEQRLDTLYHEAEAAQERLNTLNHRMEVKRERLTTLRADLRHQRRVFGRVSNQVAAMAAEDAQSPEARLSPAQRLVLTDDPDEYLSTLGAQEALSDHQGRMLQSLSDAARELAVRKQQVRGELSEVTTAQEQAAKEESTVDAKVADAEELLSELEAERRAAIEARQERQAEQVSRTAARPAPTTAVSGSAAAAVDFAMAQIGDSYVYGAAGPDAWDCSGLTMGAWGAAGVSLPHSSSGQMSSGTPVSSSELQPGDLVFYYSPVSHVGIYVGGGQIVHASNPSSPVSTTSVFSMPFSGAVRPG